MALRKNTNELYDMILKPYKVESDILMMGHKDLREYTAVCDDLVFAVHNPLEFLAYFLPEKYGYNSKELIAFPSI